MPYNKAHFKEQRYEIQQRQNQKNHIIHNKTAFSFVFDLCNVDFYVFGFCLRTKWNTIHTSRQSISIEFLLMGFWNRFYIKRCNIIALCKKTSVVLAFSCVACDGLSHASFLAFDIVAFRINP